MSAVNLEINSPTQCLPFETENIDHPLLLESLKEINESTESRAKCLEILRNELKRVTTIDPCLEDWFLLSFLRVSKFNTQKALQRMQKFYQQYDVFLDAFKKDSFPLDKAQKLDHIRISPNRLKNCSFLLTMDSRKLDYKKYSFGERFYLEILLFHDKIVNPVNQICGVTLLIDYHGFNIHAMLAHTPGWLRIFLNSLLDSFPLRVKAAHIVNAPPLFSSVFKFAQPLLPKKTKERIFFHSRNDLQHLHRLVPIEVLPERYGGKVKDADMLKGLENLEKLEKKFLLSFAFGSLENQERRKSMKIFC